MNKHFFITSLLATSLTTSAQTATSFPQTEKGMEKGVSACYAGMLGGQLIIAGGCNFPDAPAAAGGTKRFYQGIYAAPATSTPLAWKQVGTLPEPSAYGVSLQTENALILVGGSNMEHSLATVLRLTMAEDGTLQTEALPSLPCPIDNMAGTVCGNTLYIIGGNAAGVPSTAVYALSLKKPKKGWTKVADMPGNPRVQPVCAAVKNNIYVWGGFYSAGLQSEVATDGLLLNVRSKKWTPLPAPTNDAAEPITLSGGTATAIGNRIICTGGVNHDIFLDAISGRYQLTTKQEYMHHPQEWYKFNPLAFTFNAKAMRWEQPATNSSSFARAGATAVANGENLFIIGGELKPGIRTPSIIVIK